MKKTIKFIAIVFAFVMMLSAFCAPITANSDFEPRFSSEVEVNGNWYYVRNGKQITIIAYRGTDTELAIPEKIGEYTVIGLNLKYGVSNKAGDRFYFPCFDNKIETLAIPKTLKFISGGTYSNTIESDLWEINEGSSQLGSKRLSKGDFVYLRGPFLAAMPKLKAINVDKENEYFSSEDGVLFNKEKTVLISYPIRKYCDEYIVPLTVKIIFGYADNSPMFWGNGYSPSLTADRFVITKNVEHVGKGFSSNFNTIFIDNVILTEKDFRYIGARKNTIVYKDSPAHRYYKGNVTVIDNPFAKKEESKVEIKKEDKENASSKNTTSKKENAKDNSSKTESIQSQETESVISENAESEIMTIGATECNTNTDTNTEQKPQKSSNAWVIVIAAAAVILAGGGTAYWIIRKKKKL